MGRVTESRLGQPGALPDADELKWGVKQVMLFAWLLVAASLESCITLRFGITAIVRRLVLSARSLVAGRLVVSGRC